MSDVMPSGWMDAETARKWARRGVWAHGRPENTGSDWVRPCACGDDLRRLIIDNSGHHYRLIGPHPDDEPAEVGTVEIVAWCVVRENGRVFGCDTQRLANDFADGTRGAGASAKVVRLVGRTTLPAQDAVETVVGVVRE